MAISYDIIPASDARQRLENWNTAIGLQAVDGPVPSDKLIEFARDHIEGKSDIDEVDYQLKNYYQDLSARGIVVPELKAGSDEISDENDWVDETINETINEAVTSTNAENSKNCDTINETINDSENELKKTLLLLLQTQPDLSYEELAKRIGKSRSTVSRTIKNLREAERLTRTGSNKGGLWVVKS